MLPVAILPVTSREGFRFIQYTLNVGLIVNKPRPPANVIFVERREVMMYDSFDTLNSQLYSDCVSASSTVSVRLLSWSS